MKLSTGYEIPIAPSIGDLILFGGHSWVSNIIKYVTDRKNRAVSHCGVMISSTTICESTTLNGDNGVGMCPLEHWLEQYPGEVWLKYLTKQSATRFDAGRFSRFLQEQDGLPYDKTQVIFASCGLDKPDSWKAAKWYCSELAVAAYKEAGIVPVNFQPGITPADLITFPIFETPAWQLKGKAKELR